MDHLLDFLTVAGVLLFGVVWGFLAGRAHERQHLRLEWGKLELARLEHDSTKRVAKATEHEHIGTVIRCTPFDQLERVGESGIARTVAGTNVLMRCECGLFWLRWFPGTWTPDDFTRNAPQDLDKIVRELTAPEGGNTP